ncbi:MAG: hypothetical protein JNK72_26680 [Myxococcales bacterium]|nr:hypothetical protein [Myxococcales bacterium]
MNAGDRSGFEAAFAAWEAHAVPTLADDFSARVLAETALTPAALAWSREAALAPAPGFSDQVMAELALAPAAEAWAAHAVPALGADFAAQLEAEAQRASVSAAWAAHAVPALGADFTDAVMAAVAATQRTAHPVAAPQPQAEVVSLASRRGPSRRVLWPALAAAAALLVALVSGRAPRPDPTPNAPLAARPAPGPALPSATPEPSAELGPILVAEADGLGPEVTRMEVVGARSYEVISTASSAVVWIHDKPESEGLETRVQ